MANPKPAPPTVGQPPPAAWLTSSVTKYGDFSNSVGQAEQVDGKKLLLGLSEMKVVEYTASNGNQLVISTDGINADVLNSGGKILVSLTTPVGAVDPPVLSTKIPGVSNPLSGIEAVGSFFNKLSQGSTWVRIGEVAGGLILLGIGATAVLSSSKTAKQVANTAGSAAMIFPK